MARKLSALAPLSVEQRLAVNAARAARGEPFYPAGALKLGCGGCRIMDMTKHSPDKPLYCAVCPVKHLQRTHKSLPGEHVGYMCDG